MGENERVVRGVSRPVKYSCASWGSRNQRISAATDERPETSSNAVTRATFANTERASLNTSCNKILNRTPITGTDYIATLLVIEKSDRNINILTVYSGAGSGVVLGYVIRPSSYEMSVSSFLANRWESLCRNCPVSGLTVYCIGQHAITLAGASCISA